MNERLKRALDETRRAQQELVDLTHGGAVDNMRLSGVIGYLQDASDLCRCVAKERVAALDPIEPPTTKA